MTIHIFNPETDYALALGRKQYSPPASIVNLRKKMALTPAKFATENDVILLLDDISDKELSQTQEFETLKRKGLRVVRINELNRFISNVAEGEDIEIRPWGWNHSLRRILINAGIKPVLLKSEKEIDSLRMLAHRHTTIPFQEKLSSLLPDLQIPLPHEFISITEALEFASKHPVVYFKAPWSSSGRGVVCSSQLSMQEIESWIKGCLRRQGSVMGEIGFDRSADFATEWTCHKGNVEFVGLSLFKTSSTGKYLGNEIMSQHEINSYISALSPLWDKKIIDAQREALMEIIAPFYDGPAGIDMFLTLDNHLNPCVEINLRQTMGLAAFLQAQEHLR